jgi:hypothetical protein
LAEGLSGVDGDRTASAQAVLNFGQPAAQVLAAKSGSAGSSATTLPAASTNRASSWSLSASMAARPRRASTAAIVDFPAPEQPVIWKALIGVYRQPAPKAAQTSL